MTHILSPAFHERKREQFRNLMEEQGLGASLVINPVNIGYLTGFWHMCTERPLVLGIMAGGSDFAIIPGLEISQFTSKVPWLGDMDTFFDYPEGDWNWVVRQLRSRGLDKMRIGVDLANVVMTDCLDIYHTLSRGLAQEIPNVNPVLGQMRMIKDGEEIEIMRTACKYSDYLHEVAWSSLEPGVTEYELHQHISMAVIKRMVHELPEIVDTNGYSKDLIHGRTLFGASSSLPHGPKGRVPLTENSLVMITYGVGVCNYLGETERVGFYGQPTTEQREIFGVMVEAQNAALEAIRPGEPCSTVHNAMVGAVRRAGYERCLQHHTGHGKGLESHENPYFDAGEDTIMRPGMLFSVEPGLYLPGKGGYRHSDTIVVKEDGFERLTAYPRDIESLTVLPD